MLRICRQIIILFLLLIPTMQGVSGAEPVTLLQVTKKDSPADSQIILHFSDLPAYRFTASGQRLDLIMQNVILTPAFKILPEDHTIVKMEQQKYGDETTLSFLLRRPMLQADSIIKPPSKNNKNTNTLSTPVQLVLIIHWEEKSGQSTTTILPKDRPGIMQKPIGALRADPDLATATHVITSKYNGQWNIFLKEYETAVSIPVPLHYSLPPFPALALIRPAATQSVGTVDCQKIIRQSRTEGWHRVVSKIEESVRKTTTGENRDELLILYGEALVRAGFSDRAQGILVKLYTSLPDSPVGIIAEYLAVYSIAAAGKPYDAAFELSFLQQKAGDNSLTPYLDLLQTEIALATGNIDKAKILLREKERYYQGQVRRLFDLRRADMLFSADRIDAAFSLYQSLTGADPSSSDGQTVELFAFDKVLSVQDDVLADHPTSLAKYAAILYKKGDYQAALKQYINLTAILYDQPEQNLALYTAAMSQYHMGNTKEAGLILEDVIKKFPDSEGSFRARIKLNDLFVLAGLENGKFQPNGLVARRTPKSSSPGNGTVKEQAGNTATSSPQAGDTSKQEDFPRFDPALEYADIAAKASLRALREEAAFKQALSYYFTAEYEKSVELLQDFIRINKSGQLINEAEALLVELLPVVVKDKIDNKDYVDALVLAEQNRAILIDGKVKGDFLAELGLAFTRLCFWNRAIRVYLYLMDIAKDKKEEETVYLPLVQAYYEKNDLAQVEEYCHRYLADFPDGQDRAAIMHRLISALYNNGRTDEALCLLKEKDQPQSPEIQALAGRIFYEAGDYQMAEHHLARLMTSGLNDVEPEAIMMRAEALFRSGSDLAALPLYRHLEQFAAFADQAVYRIAQVHMTADDRSAGLKLLRTLVEKAKSPLWRRMATETLAMETI